MALIRVPKPPKSAYNPDRPVSSLLRSQIDHLREAESKLPLHYRSELYIKAIQTEGEAARYIREVTEAIHRAHADAARARRRPRRRRGLEIVADIRAGRATMGSKKPKAAKPRKTAGPKRGKRA
jgi:hypothetical protein